MTARKQRPLIYSCSGCSDVAQLANNVAVSLDHAGEFEMSCISGVGGKVPSLVKTARSGRPITVIDGCPLHCARACLENIGVEPRSCRPPVNVALGGSVPLNLLRALAFSIGTRRGGVDFDRSWSSQTR